MTKKELEIENKRLQELANAWMGNWNKSAEEIKKLQSQVCNLTVEFEVQQAHVNDLLESIQLLTKVLKRELE